MRNCVSLLPLLTNTCICSNAPANAPANKRAFDYSKWDAVGNDLSDSEQVFGTLYLRL
jgi:hypothetical protein